MTNTQMTVLRFGDRRAPRSLTALSTIAVSGEQDLGEAVERAASEANRIAVVGSDADLAAVLTRLMRTDRLDVEIAPIRGFRSAQRSTTAPARRVPLIRDDTGTALAGVAFWLPPEGADTISGEAVADDTVLFDGSADGIRIEPTAAMPGVRVTLLGSWPRRWHGARAVQLGATGAQVIRDGVRGRREVRRSTFYRHTTGWLRVG